MSYRDFACPCPIPFFKKDTHHKGCNCSTDTAMCCLLKNTTTNTQISRLVVNGEDLEEEFRFVNVDCKKGVAFFIADSGDDVLAVDCNKLDAVQYDND